MDPLLQTPPAGIAQVTPSPPVPPEKKTSKKIIIAGIILVVLLVIFGIGGYFLNARYQASLLPKITPESSPTPTLPPTPTITSEETALLQNPPSVILLARNNLVDKIGTQDANDIQIVSIKKVEWSDSSLGCPEPGNVYLQVIIPGYNVTFSHLGTEYEYHTDEKQNTILCPQ